MAVPNPDKELIRLERVLEKGVPPVLVVSGASDFFRNDAFERILAALPADVELRRIDGAEPSDGRELTDLRGAGLFGSGTWIAVRRADAWLKQRPDDLLRVLEAGIAPGCGLVIETKKLDRRTKLAKRLGSAGEAFEFRELYTEPYDRTRSPLEGEIVGWLTRRAHARGVPLSAEAAYLVVTTVGAELPELVAELERLALAMPGRRQRISAEELRGHLTVGFGSNPFEFADAVLAFDRRRALRSLDAMYTRGVKTKDGRGMDAGGLFPFITSWLHTSLATALRGRRLYDAGVRIDEIPGRLGARAFIDRLRSQIADNPEPRLRRGMHLLLEAQRELRLTGEDPWRLLERFLARYFRGGAA